MDDWKELRDLPNNMSGQLGVKKFDPDNVWLVGASSELQIEAMRRWFYARFEEPVNQMPWDGEDKEYIFFNGGPYSPYDVLQDRFGSVVHFQRIELLIDELVREGGPEWASTDWSDNYYDAALEMAVLSKDDPARFLKQRLADIDAALKQVGNGFQYLMLQLLHSAVITALEAYLLDTMSYWISERDEIFERFVTTNTDISSKSMKTGDLFKRLATIRNEVRDYLQEFVWHRLDKVKPMMESTLMIAFPEIQKIMSQVVVRHHIVHRGGRDKTGEPVFILVSDVVELANHIKTFSESLEAEIEQHLAPKKEAAFEDDDIPF